MALDPTLNAVDVCECCAGASQQTPQSTDNRPGLAAIAYRVGTHSQFKESLLARLHTSHQPPLDELRARGDDDFTIALLDAFATAADVLTFYTERIANEAYLRTATERRSVLELARLVGYELRPGVAASALLAFTIDPAPGAFGTALIPGTTAQVVPETPTTVTVGIGTKVLSVPGPGEQPQTFETVEAIAARADWNAPTPRLTQPQQVQTSAQQFILSGSVSTVKKGDRILILPTGGGNAPARIQNVAIVSNSTSADPTAAITIIDTTPVPDGSVGYSPSSLAVSTLPPNGSIDSFGANTPLDASAIQKILAVRWDADTLRALAGLQKWSLDQLSTDLNEQIALQNGVANGAVHVFRQRAAVFGYNAPNWDSLPPGLRYEGVFWIADTTTSPVGSNPIAVQAAYPNSWENLTLEDVSASSGTQWTIYLDALYPEIVPGSWIALLMPDGTTANAQIEAVGEVTHARFTLSGKVTMLTIEETSPPLSSFLMRKTTVLCQSEPLPLAPVPVVDVVQGQWIPLDRAYLELPRDKTVLITGERSDLSGVTVTEARTLLSVVLDQGFTIVKLDSPLDHSYVRSTVSINANVALATHGESVQSILDPLALTTQSFPGLLGSGDGSQAFQKVGLQFSPLTYVSADSPSGTRSTLEVRVDGLLWNEVPFLYGHGPEDHIYLARQDDDGHTTVIFGDGVTGSRLPTGQHNIQARYRKGIGLGGLVRANQLSQLMVRPAGVKAVNNPLPAVGAADPEAIEDARRNVTLTITTLDRIVSLEDYQNFARAFAGVDKAIATWTWSGEQRIVLVTVAGSSGAPIDPKSTLYGNLYQALVQYAEPFVTVRLFSYDAIYFQLSGAVTVRSDYLLDEVAASVEASLRTAFSFTARDFGQPVHVSEVIAAIQNVVGVQDVVLTELYRSDLNPAPPADIAAAVPRPGKDEIFAAQLLMLDPRPLALTVTQ